MKKDEVEEFLRRAAQRKAQAEAQRRGGANPPMRQGPTLQPPRAAPAQPPPRTPPARLVPAPVTQNFVPLEPLDVEVVEAELAESPGRMSRVVNRDTPGTRQVGQRATHFAEQVGLADDNMEAHVHAVFDHKLGHLAKDGLESGRQAATASPNDTRVSEAAASIAQMMRSPQTLRLAIILNEIMQPPKHWW